MRTLMHYPTDYIIFFSKNQCFNRFFADKFFRYYSTKNRLIYYEKYAKIRKTEIICDKNLRKLRIFFRKLQFFLILVEIKKSKCYTANENK